MTLPYRENASVIVTRADGKFLIVRKPREYNAWQFPQGGLEMDEDARTAAMREFTEELGTDKIRIAEQECGIFRYEWSEEMQRERGFAGQNVHFFRAEFLGADSDIHLQIEELVEFRWVSEEEFENYFEDQNYLKTVLQILESENH